MHQVHRIRRQLINVRTCDRGSAFAVRARLRRDLDETLLPAIERAFDALNVGAEVVRVPRLALELKIRNLDELASRLQEALREQLHIAFSGANSAIEVRRRQPPAVRRRESLLHYLQHGQLDWPDMHGDSATQVARLRDDAQLLARRWLAAPNLFGKVLPDSPLAALAFLTRFLQLLPPALLNEWLAAMVSCSPHASNARVPKKWVSLAIESSQDVQVAAHLRLHLQAVTLSLAWADVAFSMRDWLSSLRSSSLVDASVYSALEGLLDADDRSKRRAHAPNSSVPGNALAARVRNRRDRELDTIGASHINVTVNRAEPPIQLIPQPDPDIGVRVYCAGLILTHPFLPSLFSACRLLSDSGELPAHNLPRAAALLHWLATGRDDIYEFELGLIKLLLGLRPSDPLPIADGLLCRDDIDECQALLAALISHWPALRSTTAEGLQVSFLQRQGLLRATDAGWQLQIESETFDMLLAQLPWSIGIVKLPWTPKPIFTHWPTL